MAKEYDLVVIGTGTAAIVASSRVRAAGWSVAVIDFRPFGGTCALRGCDPKKMLVTGAEAVDLVQRMHSRGVEGNSHIDWPDLIAFKRSFTGPVPAKHEHRYDDKGIDTYHGRARFVGPDTVEVDGSILKARHVLIASGARPVPLGFPGQEHLVTNEEFLDMDVLPRRIVMVGGGYIAAEFSHIAARAGAEVTVLQRGDHLLKGFDPDLVGWLMERFREIGIDVRTNASVEAVEKVRSGFVVRTRSAEGEQVFHADLVIHAAGRVPDLYELDLDVAGIEHNEGRLKLNDHLQSVSNLRVYAAGDAAAVGPPLTPVSSHDAKVVASNLLEGNSHRPDYRGVPSVAFTIPPIARVGLSEEEARKQGLRFRMKSELVPGWYTARRVAETVYGFKVLVDEDSDHILGAHLVGPHADEVINYFGLAIRHGLTAEDIKTTMFAYPTGASDIGYML